MLVSNSYLDFFLITVAVIRLIAEQMGSEEVRVLQQSFLSLLAMQFVTEILYNP